MAERTPPPRLRPSSAEILFDAIALLDVAAGTPDPAVRVEALRARLAGADVETARRVAACVADLAVQVVVEARRSRRESVSSVLARVRLEYELAASP